MQPEAYLGMKFLRHLACSSIPHHAPPLPYELMQYAKIIGENLVLQFMAHLNKWTRPPKRSRTIWLKLQPRGDHRIKTVFPEGGHGDDDEQKTRFAYLLMPLQILYFLYDEKLENYRIYSR